MAGTPGDRSVGMKVANPHKEWHARGMPTSADDLFTKVRAQTLRHRAQHGCVTYPFLVGAIVGVIAAAVAPMRVL